MTTYRVYRAIYGVSADLSVAGIPKLRRNQEDDYFYRSIDDVLNRLAPLLVKHKLCILPRVLERTSTDRAGDGDLLLVSVALKVAFDIICVADGSTHTVEAYGEALDAGDKATAKAMSAAYKSTMLQTFCVPVAQTEDADASAVRLKRNRRATQPIEGWDRWSTGIIDIVASCETDEALERVQEKHRLSLTSLSRERPDLYANLGTAFSERRSQLAANDEPMRKASRAQKTLRPAESAKQERHADEQIGLSETTTA